MTAAVSVGADIKNPTHDISLSDGVTTVGLLLSDRNGKRDPLAIKRSPYPRQSTKISQTNNQYSDLEPPYYALVQNDWSGGRGSLNFEEDTARYLDSFRAWTEQEKQVMCGPQETYCQDFGATYKQNFQSLPGKVNFTALMDTNTYLAHKFTTVAAVTIYQAAVILKRVGTPTDLLAISIYTDNAGVPNTQLGMSVVWAANVADFDTTSQLYQHSLILTAPLDPATSYWIVVTQNTGTPTTANHWEVGTNPTVATNTKKSTDGATWSAASYELYYRIIDGGVDPWGDEHGNTYNFKFVEYKHAIYGFDLTHGHIFLNGDRGWADDNAADKTYLNDALKAWVNDEWIDCIVLITKGPGSEETQPWRKITDNTATTLKVEPDWITTHTTATEYVILGSNKWTYLNPLNQSIQDITVAGDFMYIATGNDDIYHFYWGENATYCEAETIAHANKLCAINTPTGWELWGGWNNSPKHNRCVWKAKVPRNYSSSAYLYNLISVLDDGKGVWDEQVVTNVTVSKGDDGMAVALAAGFTTGLACSKEIAATDITKATKLGILMKTSVVTAAPDLDIKLDDTPFCGRNYLPDHVWHFDGRAFPNDVMLERAYYRPTAVNYYDGSVTPVGALSWFRIGNLIDGITSYDFKMTYEIETLGDFLYISYPERMQGIYIDMGTTKNAVAASTMTAEVWDGDSWVAQTITDGTSAGAVTLAQSGLIRLTPNSDWNMGCSNTEATYLAADRFHIRLKFDKDLTAAVQIARITAHGDGNTEVPVAGQFVSLKNALDLDTAIDNVTAATLYNNDAIYIRYSKRFNRIKFTINGTYFNNNPSSLAGYYWAGPDGWVTLSITDGTKGGAAPNEYTLSATGDITWTNPTAWHPGCPSYLTPYLSETDFIVKLVLTVNDAAVPNLDWVVIHDITVEDDSLEDIYTWNEKNNVKDGWIVTYDYLNLSIYDYLYVMFSSKFNKVYFTIPDDTNDNDVDTTMTAQYFNGYAWTTLTLTADGTEASAGHTTFNKSGAISFTIPHDWQPISIGEETGYAVRFTPVASLTPRIKLTEIYVQNDDALTVSIPAMTVANQWYYHEIAITPNANPNPDESAIVSIGLYIAVDNGAQTITIGSVDLITGALDYYKIGDTHINAIEAYGDERVNPWVFTENMVYEVQTQNDYAVVPMPLREIKALSSETNGIAHTVSNVYMIFNLGSFIEQYYQHNLDDVGPNRDEGLPANRQGDPVCLISYPGRIFLAINAGIEGYSTVLVKKSSGWHEIYRAPYGCPIHDLAIQVIPGKSTRLWISQEYDILWLPLPTDTWNPKNDSDFRYTHESVVTTGWITCGFLDILKFWYTVKLYTENLSGTDQFIKCEYQTEDGALESAWTAITDVFDTSPFEEQTINAAYTVTARRIRFRFKLITTSNLESPILKANVIDALLRFPVKYMYTGTAMLLDHEEDLTGEPDYTARVETKTAQLDIWANAPTVLTMRCLFSPYDNKKVVLEPLDSNPIPPEQTDAQLEKHLANFTLLSVV